MNDDIGKAAKDQTKRDGDQKLERHEERVAYLGRHAEGNYSYRSVVLRQRTESKQPTKFIEVCQT